MLQAFLPAPAQLATAAGLLLRGLASKCGSQPTHSRPVQQGPTKKLGLRDVQHIIAVTSAKGGVGKSTCAVNIAAALATSLKQRVGLLDADIHGPSIPHMMNLSGKPDVSEMQDPLLRPKENYRIKCMSFGFFMEPDEPVIWRGPMVNSAFDKMLFGTEWGDLDVLVVDMPPGTGDAQINLGQRIPLSGAVVVSTPQDIALIDVRRGVQMFRRLNVPILGMVENMSHHVCKNCGHIEHTFGEGGVAQSAEKMGLPVLGQVPLDITIRSRSDSGAPIVVSEPNSPGAKAYISIAERVLDGLKQQGTAGAAGPKIVVE